MAVNYLMIPILGVALCPFTLLFVWDIYLDSRKEGLAI